MHGSIDICINCNDDNDLDDNDDDQSNDGIHNNSYNYLTSIGCAPRYPNKSICIILRSN